MSDINIKICVLGAPKTGKTTFCKVLAEQSLGGDSSVAVRCPWCQMPMCEPLGCCISRMQVIGWFQRPFDRGTGYHLHELHMNTLQILAAVASPAIVA